MKGLKPEWADLPERFCLNCEQRFKPKTPTQRFCQDTCRADWHHGDANLKRLKYRMDRQLEKKIRQQEQALKKWLAKRQEQLARIALRQIAHDLNVCRLKIAALEKRAGRQT